MKLYIAGASAEIERCEAFRDAAVALGYEITADWMAMIQLCDGAANHGLSPEARHAARSLAVYGIHQCDLFVLLMPRPPATTIGAWYEWNRAESAGKRCLIVGVDAERTVMTAGCDVIESDADALEWMRGRLANGGGYDPERP